MKKLITTILFASVAIVAAFASPVDRLAAQKTAQKYFGASEVSLAWSAEVTKASSSPAYYAFNNPAGGWVIIAGDDCCEPVLACSATGSFSADNLPANFLAWMNGIRENIEKVRGAGLEQSESMAAKWASCAQETKSGVSETLIETASWGQSQPYCANCPKIKGEYCYTGCVATAMAIVLRHNKYPSKLQALIPSYKTSTNNITIPIIPAGETYSWNNMPLEYTSSATSTQKAEVAKLIYHCGAMVEMDYGTDASSARSEKIVRALAKYMGYCKSAREIYRYNYSNNDWFKMIKAEIDADRPILYGGADKSSLSGHQFVVDGYDSNNKVHINWGWDGECNAWYAINYLGDKDPNSINCVFSYVDGAIVGLYPENGTSTKYNAEISLESYPDYNKYGISLRSGEIAKGASFNVDLAYIVNYDTDKGYEGSVKVGLYDKNGNLKEYVSAEKSISLGMATYSSDGYIESTYDYIEDISCTITQDIALGDYLMAVYKLTDGSWAMLGGYSSDEYTDSSYEYYTIYKLGVLDLAYINIPSEISAGQMIYFELVGSHKLPDNVTWYWDGKATSLRAVSATSGTHTVKAVVTYTDSTVQTIQKTININ